MDVDLFEQHAAILAAADDFLAMLHGTPRPDMVKLNRLRVKLSGLVRRHAVAEEELIYSFVRAHGSDGQFAHLEAIMADLLQEKLAYSEHIRAWTPSAIEADWANYVIAVTARLNSARHVIEVEEQRLYPPILGQMARQRQEVGALPHRG